MDYKIYEYMETLHRAPRQFGCIKDQGEIEKQMDLAL
jgi:hypothetical protein